MVTSVGSTVLTALGASSLDTASLVDQLATAANATKSAALTTKETANTAKISDLGTAISTMSSFSSSLSSLISGGTLYTQPTSSNTALVKVSALSGARLSSLSATMTVDRLATAQTMTSAGLAGSSATVGEGTLELKVGDQTKTITIDSTNNTLAGLAKAIKDSGLNVTTSLVADSSGTRLVVKGATGDANAFSLKMTSGDASGIGRFAYDPDSYDANNVTGLELKQDAQDAQLTVDGVSISKASNSFSDVIEGVKIDLQGAAPGQTISIGASQPKEAITQAVNDFVAAYNEMKTTLSGFMGTSGSLKSDSGMRDLMRKMAQLTTTPLTYVTDGSPTTLAEIGVSTNRDGSLSVDASRLSTIMSANPDAVEAMFNPGQRSSSPLIQVTSAIGKTKGGVYTITDVTAATGSTTAAGKIDGVSALPSGTDSLQASFFAAAAGLTFKPLGSVSSATITIDTGLQGAFDAIKTLLTSSTGSLTSTQNSLATEKKSIADEKQKLTDKDTAYREKLTTQYTKLQTALRSYSSTSSYLTQQITLWQNQD
jgi:flagellar hook-associated protein 2